jgi:hypothetical protein
MAGPHNKEGFATFLKILKTGQAGHWIDVARAIGVTDDTITNWKKLPEAQQAIQEGIANALAKMETAGAKDWRMWESKLKMLGLNPASKVDVVIDDPRKRILKEYLGEDDAGKVKEAQD